MFSLPPTFHSFSKPGPTTWTNRLEKISSDRSFKCPTIDFARVIVNEQRAVHKHPSKRSVTRPTYFYEFTHRTKSLPWPTWAGVMHGYEIEYVFGIPFSPLFTEAFYGFTDEERELSDVMMTYWANFARTGSIFHYYYTFYAMSNVSITLQINYIC
ncbi:unnamed protein product [Dibothriocephalus latus]|uniref:Carboxylesterase type B domain-containing protein n=1 Tax=Dibothriocephalus latus TaxID=60516 RepID=A0A3P7MBK0_DIBLA|nr:unnamed protein product [Dibothriocephalus latus]